jgi:Tol biopolymer transport system component
MAAGNPTCRRVRIQPTAAHTGRVKTLSGIAIALALLGIGSAGASPSSCRNGRILFLVQHYVQPAPAIYLVPFAGGEPVRAVPGAAAPVWSPLGDRLAYFRGRSVVIGAPVRTHGRARIVKTAGVHDRLGAPSWSPRGNQVAFAITRGKVTRIWVGGLDGRARLVGPTSVLERDRPPSWSPDGRSLVLTGYHRPNGFFLRIVDVATGRGHPIPNTGEGFFPAWSPDGELIAFQTRGGFDVIAPNGRHRRNVAGNDALIGSWSPDSRFITMTDQKYGVAAVVNVAEGREQMLHVDVGVLGWDPSSRWVIGVAADSIVIVDPSTGTSRFLVKSGWELRTGSIFDPPAVSRSGVAAFVGYRHPYGDTSLFSVPSGGGRASPFGHVRGESPAWSADGTQVAYEADGTIWVVDAEGAHKRAITLGEDPAWSPDGTQLAVQRPVGSVDHVFVVSLDGATVRDLGPGDFPAWSPDGSRIAVAGSDDEIDVYPATGGPAQAVTHVAAAANGCSSALKTEPAWSPDGRTIAFVELYGTCYDPDRGGSVATVKLATGVVTEIGLLLGDNDGWRSPAWSPDGRYLAAAYQPESGSPMRIVRVQDKRVLWKGANEARQPAWQPVCTGG